VTGFLNEDWLQKMRKFGFPCSTRVFLTVMMGIGLVGFMTAQPQPSVAFEVVSIKANPEKMRMEKNGRLSRGGFRAYSGPLPVELRGLSGDRFVEQAATVGDLIADAYRKRPCQIFGLPTSADFQAGGGYDLEAKLPAGKSWTSDEVRRMLQTALSNRFQLKAHRESRVLPVYELTLSKGSTKMRAAPPGTKGTLMFSTILGMIEQFLDRPLSDKTGLSGSFEDRWNQDELLQERRALGPGATAPSIFSAVKDQLGLELKATKAPYEVLVIDSVQRPSVN
jgi:hypothetical protein